MECSREQEVLEPIGTGPALATGATETPGGAGGSPPQTPCAPHQAQPNIYWSQSQSTCTLASPTLLRSQTATLTGAPALGSTQTQPDCQPRIFPPSACVTPADLVLRQQESESSHYLHRLFSSVQTPPGGELQHHLRHVAQPATPTPAPRTGVAQDTVMADFLASFDLGGHEPADPSSTQCTSIDDLCLQLRAILDSKSTPHKAEHISTTLELSSAATLSLAVSHSEIRQFEGLGSIDPSLGGLDALAEVNNGLDGLHTRLVVTGEALENQPQTNPVRQKAVARHIVDAVGATDQSQWTMREVTRTSEGWKFVYSCKGSMQEWTRAHPKDVVTDFTQKELDSSHLEKPAFDCRGSVTILFSQESRTILVTYEHTPIHRSLGELREYFRPPPRELPATAVTVEPKVLKTPKKAKTPRKKAQGQDGTPDTDKSKVRKRQKKSTSDTHTTSTTEGTLAQTQDTPLDPSLAPAATGTTTFSFSLSPEEAARRKDMATKLLTDAGVDPATLSSDQFHIFSNQSPDLQKESLAMLAKYGAERLRVVHPSNREGSAPAPTISGTTTPTGAQGSAAPNTTEELVPQDGVKAKRKRKSKAARDEVDEAADTEASMIGQAHSTQTGTTPKKMGKSRLACFLCKERKVKCPKERPSCSECATTGSDCVYPPQKPRARKSTAEVDNAGEEAETEVEAQPIVEAEPESEPDLPDAQLTSPSDYQPYAQMPVADMLAPAGDRASYPSPEISSLPAALMQTDPSHSGIRPDQITASAELRPTQPQSYTQPEGIAQEQSHGRGSSKAMQSSQQNGRKSQPSSRRSLPEEPYHQPLVMAQGAPTNRMDGLAWTASNMNPAMSTSTNAAMHTSMPQMASQSPEMVQQRTRNSTNSPQVRTDTQLTPRPQSGMQQHQSSPRSVAAMQAQSRVSPTTVPPHSHERSSSRSSQRGPAQAQNSRADVRLQLATTGQMQQPGGSNAHAASKDPGATANPSIGEQSSGTQGSSYGDWSSYGSWDNRVPYQPYSQQTGGLNMASLQGPDYNRPASNNVATQNNNATTSQSTSGDWSITQNKGMRNANTGHAQTANTPTNQQPSNSSQGVSGSSQNFRTNGMTTVGHGHAQPQSNGYPGFSNIQRQNQGAGAQHQSQSQRQQQQQQGWYNGFSEQGGTYGYPNWSGVS